MLVDDAFEDARLRIYRALDLASSFGQIDGDHHKTWVIDQMVRALLGAPPAGPDSYTASDEYETWVSQYCNGEDGPETYVWEEGIAP
jgi:hypothetical protein